MLAFVFCLLNVKAQEDSVLINSFARFEKNANELNDLFLFSNSGFYPGKFRFSKPSDVHNYYLQINRGLFPDFSNNALMWYQFLQALPDTSKKNLIRCFSFYEENIELALENAGLPSALKYLAPAVSSMNFAASGNERRAGVWQLTHFQAILNGGKITKLVDERMNVNLETQMAVSQLKQNFEMYGDPELAVAAFLCGNTKVKNVLCQAGENTGDNTVLEMLPAEVKQTIAAFQAIAVFLNANRFETIAEPLKTVENPDTAFVYRRLHFQQVEDVIHIPVTQLHELNPQYIFQIIPESDKPQPLVLPHGKKDDFLVWNDSIYNAGDSSLFQLITQKIEYPPAPNRQYTGTTANELSIDGKTKIEYRIKSGDVLGLIAEKYSVKVSDIKYWNNIYNERRIQAGQKINIFVPDDRADYYSWLDKKTAEKSTSSTNIVKEITQSTVLPVPSLADEQNKVVHVVKSGESPYFIAQKYKGVTPELILQWNNIDDARKIQIGQKLILYPKK